MGMSQEWTVPQLIIMIIYNSKWSILIQSIRVKLSGDNLTYIPVTSYQLPVYCIKHIHVFSKIQENIYT